MPCNNCAYWERLRKKRPKSRAGICYHQSNYENGYPAKTYYDHACDMFMHRSLYDRLKAKSNKKGL